VQALRTIWTRSSDEDGTDELAQLVVHELRKVEPFRLWLVGDLGAGKTFLSGRILRALGLPAHAPVTSPTYTYCNEYQIGNDWYAHIDLYRAGPQTSLEELGLVDARKYRGYLVEWPEQIPAHPVLAADFILRIDFASGGGRRYTLLG
jgi:tRNA threonylcarbamoyl adenosine modification protein YjeE